MFTDVTDAPTRRQAILISAGLVYLCIPNLLFLSGWFTPVASITVGGLILLYVYRAIRLLYRETAPPAPVLQPGTSFSFILVLLLASLIVTFLFVIRGCIGIWPTNWDYYVFRQALLSNLSDAPWPLILPNGKEMSYYIANLLPQAVLGRIQSPDLLQYGVVVWSVIPVMLSLLLMSTAQWDSRISRGSRLLFLTFGIFIFSEPLRYFFPPDGTEPLHKGICFFSALTGIHLEPLVRIYAIGTYLNPMYECCSAYNSAPPLLLAVSMFVASGKTGRYIIPLVVTLLAALSPLGCMGLMPLAAVLFFKIQKGGFKSIIRKLLKQSLLPMLMLLLLAVYFLRAEGSVRAAPLWVAWGWWECLLFFLRMTVAWSLLVLPLWFVFKSDPIFRVTAVYLLLGYLLFIGSLPNDGFGRMNEFWLKSSPAYTLLLIVYWCQGWRRVGGWKYLILLGSAAHIFSSTFGALSGTGERGYLDVEDAWNGHLNHDAAFLNQSVPPCKEPIIPCLMLRQSGESERYFPGRLLPKAPGCDYSRPPKRER